MRRRTLIYCLLFLCFQFVNAQKEATFWYFGENAGLDFSSGSPVALTNGALSTLEGCASISDIRGNLLFYTDGTSVWNRQHRLMPTGTPLAGNSSSSQSAIVVPKPDDPKLYYIFTVDWSGGARGLNYYTVDMTLDGGLGDVLGKDNVPGAFNLLTGPSSEKISAVKVLFEDAFWVITSKFGRFFVYKVDSNGVNPVPIVGNDNFVVSSDSRGYLKASPDGTKLVAATMSSGTFIYDFNSLSGIITNERELDVEGEHGYGVEFSQSGMRLYISTGKFGSGNPENEFLYQFNLELPNPTAENISATRVRLHSYINGRAALQIGLDGKIYRAIDNSNFLGVINDPEELGLAADYIHEAISLGDRKSRQGLPPFIQSFFVADIQAFNICFRDETRFTINSNEPILSIVWDFGDGTSTSTALSPTHVYTAAGEYTVTATVTTADETKIIDQFITILPIPELQDPFELKQCDDNTDGLTNFNLTEVDSVISLDEQTLVLSYYLNQQDADDELNPIENIRSFSNASASQIILRAENAQGCYNTATVNLTVSTTTVPNDFMLNYSTCDSSLVDNDDSNGVDTFDFSAATAQFFALFPSEQNLVVSYYETFEHALEELNALDPANFRNENSPGVQQIVVRIESSDNNECLGLGYYITLTVNDLPQFDLPEIAALCTSDLPLPSRVLQVDNPRGSYEYQWFDQDGNLINTEGSTRTIIVTEIGEYAVTATSSENCSRTKTVRVVASNIARIDSIDISDDSENNSVTVNVSGLGDYEFALNTFDGPYQTSNSFENVAAGRHIVYVRDRNGCGVVSEEIAVIGFPRFLTPNGDGFNDTWQVFGVALQPASKIHIFDRFGKILAQLDPTSLGWDGTYRGRPLPQSDYWFRVQLEDGRIRSGHFSLIRK